MFASSRRGSTRSTRGGDLLADSGWDTPDPESYPDRGRPGQRYLQPLAELPALRPRIRLETEVMAVTRDGFDKMKTPGRDDAPFVVTVRTGDGEERDPGPRRDRCVRDLGAAEPARRLGPARRSASGPWPTTSPTGFRMSWVRPGARYAGKRVLVVGSGHSAFNVLLDLVDLADEAPGTAITWAIRKPADRDRQPLRRRDQRCAAGPRRAGCARAGAGRGRPAAAGDRGADRPDRADRGRASSPPGRTRCCRRSTRSLPRPGSGRTWSCSPSSGLGSTRPWRARPALAPLIDPNVHILRLGAPPRRGGAEAPGAGFLHGGHEELRAGADLPDADRLRAGALGGGGPGRGLGGRARCAAGAAGNGRLLVIRVLGERGVACCGTAAAPRIGLLLWQRDRPGVELLRRGGAAGDPAAAIGKGRCC